MSADDAESPRQGGPLRVGQSFGDRYRIEALLGVGGMGAVYRAWDRELDTPVALKVIRPEIAGDGDAGQELSQRFKRELLLARKVTHPNVVRIHDLGDIDGIKYITMTYIEGETLAARLAREGALPVREALRVMHSVASGMLAAHAAGVVHRDLKPANIMMEESTGEPILMDFGIARSVEMSGLTATGSLLGTVQYMAPEQFSGSHVDQRADIYAMGLICYDMLVGPRRFESSDSALDEFRSRIRQAPEPLSEVDPTIPKAIDRMVRRCLDPEPGGRYQETEQLVDDLQRIDDQCRAVGSARTGARWVAMAAAAALAVALAGAWWVTRRPAPPADQEPISVLIADFDNETGDPSFEHAFEQALTIAMEGAGFVTAYPRPNALRIAQQLQPESRLDQTMARLVSRREGISVILAGTIEHEGDRYTLSVAALDPGIGPDGGEPLATATAEAGDKAGVLTAVAEVAAELRRELGDTTPISDQLAAAETFTAASLDAMRAYARGQELAWAGQFEGALEAYRQAIAADPEFGRAWAGMGVLYGNLRREAEAEESFQQAFQHLDRMTERERYRTLGGYYLLVSRNFPEAIDNYRTLVELYPADSGGHGNLAYAYYMARDFERAMAAGRSALELYPGNLVKRINLAMYAMSAGDFETAIAESEIVFEQNPDFGYALLTEGRSALAAGDVGAARDAFERLGASDAMGSSLAPTAKADLELYLGHAGTAAAVLEPAIESSDNPFETASMLIALADARIASGSVDDADESARWAVELSQHESVLYLAGRVLLQVGDHDGAEELAVRLDDTLQSHAAALATLLRGEQALRQGDLTEAIDRLRRGRQEYDFWFAHFLMGRAYFDAGHLPEAFDEFEACVGRIGECVDLFLVDSATLRYYPPALYWLGRAQQALGGREAASGSYRRYLDLRGTAAPPDPLAVDARQRIGEG